ncbi:unnamed protein product [Penicillium olsonii]|nr:unnamed protein product [Penicillium olsonii]
MAPITKTLALAGAFFAMTGYAAPVAKRAVVWETVTDVVWTTVDVTTTVYPNQAPTATVVPVATTAVPTAAAAVVTSTETPAETPTETPIETPVETPVETPAEKKKAAPTTSTSTTEAAPAPTAEVEASIAVPAPTAESSAPAPAQTTSTSSAAAANTRSANIQSTASTGYTGACSEGSPCDGMITFYDTATTSTNPSSCGTTNDGASENVLALPVGIMKDGDCGKTVTITYNGQTATGTVVDKCMGCDDSSIDLSRHLFGQLASMDAGRVSGAKWYIH